jgi:hypothetical protein
MSTTTTTAKRRRTSRSIPKKTAYPITRKATFVGDKDLPANVAMTKMLGSINPVTRTTLNNRPDIRGGPTVYFKPGGHTAGYAVASTRIARFLGMEEVIAHNAFARIRDEDGAVSGEVLGVPLRTLEHAVETQIPDEYKSGPVPRPDEIENWLASKGSEVVQRDGKYFKLTGYVHNPIDYKDPRVQKGMSDLQLFDAISGQSDRHGGNIYVHSRSGKVTGIDDDQSISGRRLTEAVDRPWQKYPGLPPLVDRATANRILGLRPENLRHFLGPRENDLMRLTQEEIQHAQRRLREVQDHLEHLAETGGIVDTWDDGTYQTLMQDPDKTYLGRAAVDLRDALNGGTLDGYPLRVGPPLEPPPPLPPMPQTGGPPVRQWGQVMPRGGPSPRTLVADQRRAQPPSPPPTITTTVTNPMVTTTTTASTTPSFVPPLSRRSPARAATSRLAVARLRPDAPAEKGEKEKEVSPRSPVLVDPTESSSEPDDPTVPIENDVPTDTEPTDVEKAEVLQALLQEFRGEAERTDLDREMRVLNALLDDLTGSTNES